MGSITIKQISFAEFQAAPNLADLLAGYARESALPELGGIDPQWAMYERMESAGVAVLLAAFSDDVLVGFLVLIVSVVPHFGRAIASTESIYVAPEHRKSGAGMRLLHEAESIARGTDAVGLYVSAPHGSQLAEVLDKHKSYRETNHLFFRGLQ